MSNNIDLKKGLDIPVAGKAAPRTDKQIVPDVVALKPGDFKGFVPRLLVKEGDKVRLEKKEGDTFTLSFVSGEDSYTGPFTGMFKELAKFKDMEDPWGDDPVEYVRKLRDDSNVEKRELPDF